MCTKIRKNATVPTTSPLLFTAEAPLAIPPGAPRSTIPPDCVHAKACDRPPATSLSPTTSPCWLTATAMLLVPPNVPRSVVTTELDAAATLGAEQKYDTANSTRSVKAHDDHPKTGTASFLESREDRSSSIQPHAPDRVKADLTAWIQGRRPLGGKALFAIGHVFGIDPTRLANEDTEDLLPLLADQVRYHEAQARIKKAKPYPQGSSIEWSRRMSL